MSVRDRRDEGVRTVHRLARDAFARHEIVMLTDDRLVCAQPRSGTYGFEILRMGWGRVAVHGDIDVVTFQGGDGGNLAERIAWLAGSDVEYLQQKAGRSSGRDYWRFDADALADAIQADIDEARSEWSVDDAGDGAASSADDPPEGDDEDGGTCRLRAETPKDLRDDLDEAEELVSDIRSFSLHEHEVWTRLHDLRSGHFEYEHPTGYVYYPALLWAHEAARVAFDLLRPDRALARFLDVPSVEALRLYNAAERLERCADAARLAYARQNMAWDVRRIRGAP